MEQIKIIFCGFASEARLLGFHGTEKKKETVSSKSVVQNYTRISPRWLAHKVPLFYGKCRALQCRALPLPLSLFLCLCLRLSCGARGQCNAIKLRSRCPTNIRIKINRFASVSQHFDEVNSWTIAGDSAFCDLAKKGKKREYTRKPHSQSAVVTLPTDRDFRGFFICRPQKAEHLRAICSTTRAKVQTRGGRETLGDKNNSVYIPRDFATNSSVR